MCCGGQNGDYKGKEGLLRPQLPGCVGLSVQAGHQWRQRHFPAELTLGSTKGLGLPKWGQNGGAVARRGVGRLHWSAGRALSLR